MSVDPADRPVDDGSKRIWIIGVTLVALAGAGYWFYRQQLPTIPPSVSIPDAGFVDAGPPDSGIESLPLADGDALLRALLAEATSSPEIAKWLGAEGLIRRITTAVFLISEGKSPRPALGFVEIEGNFAFREPPLGKKAKNERTVIAPESYSRYDNVTRVLTSVDPATAGMIYGRVRPWFDSVFAEVGRPGERFDDVLAAAIRRLRAVQIPGTPVALVPKGAMWAFEDPALESLPEAEKHLVRMGRDNGTKIQGYLQRFSDAAGLPSQPAQPAHPAGQ